MRGRLSLATVTCVLIGVSATGCGLDRKMAGPSSSDCRVTAGGQQQTLDPEQVANAATIAAVGLVRQVPDRAITVALATAFQESKMRNLTGGDRDSIGLFQQRPSQGWGDPQQLGDPRYAAGQFYDHLSQVDGWSTMRVTDAAQAVQHSADAEAYQKWAVQAQNLTTSLAGEAPATLGCTLVDKPKFRGSDAQANLTASIQRDWGQSVGAQANGTTGLTIPVSQSRTGWQVAHWLVAYADTTGVQQVAYAGRTWNVNKDSWSAPPSGAQEAANSGGPVQVALFPAASGSG